MSVVKSKGWKEYAIYSDKMRVLIKAWRQSWDHPNLFNLSALKSIQY